MLQFILVHRYRMIGLPCLVQSVARAIMKDEAKKVVKSTPMYDNTTLILAFLNDCVLIQPASPIGN